MKQDQAYKIKLRKKSKALQRKNGAIYKRLTKEAIKPGNFTSPQDFNRVLKGLSRNAHKQAKIYC